MASSAFSGSIPALPNEKAPPPPIPWEVSWIHSQVQTRGSLAWDPSPRPASRAPEGATGGGSSGYRTIQADGHSLGTGRASFPPNVKDFLR